MGKGEALRRQHESEEVLYHRGYLSKYGDSGEYACACGLRHRIGTSYILFGRNALCEVAALLAETRGKQCKLWILSDANTEQAAGGRLKEVLAGFRLEQRVLPGEPKPEPTIEIVETLVEEVRSVSPDLLIAVGGGTISDIVKKVSHDTGVSNWCVLTSPSVDAFTSAKAAIWFKGYHKAVPSNVSEVVVCDLSVLEKAPRELFLAGLGDLLGKYLAYLDWHLSHWITEEPICEEASRLGLQSADRALTAANYLADDRERATRYLADAALTSGMLMQIMGSSRPAASAEHTISHFWEMFKTVKKPEYDLHGILVGLASQLVLEVYKEFFRSIPDLNSDIAARLASFRDEPDWEQALGDEILPFKFKMVEEMEGKGIWTEQRIKERLQRFRSRQAKIGEFALEQIQALEKAVATLSDSGFPFSFSNLDALPKDIYLPFPYERYLRDRYTAFDLMYELGVEGRMLEKLAGYISKHG